MQERIQTFTAKDGQPFECYGACRVTVTLLPGKGRRFDVTVEPLPLYRRRDVQTSVDGGGDAEM